MWAIKIESGWTNKNRGRVPVEKFFRLSYPAAYNYLKNIGDKMKNSEIGVKGKGLFDRDDRGDYWWELRDCSYYSEFEKEKIAWQRVTKTSMFCLVEKDMYIHDSMAFMISNNSIRYLLSLSNSNLLRFYFESIGHQYGNTGFLCSNQYIERIPIPKILEFEQKPFIELVNKIFALTQSNNYLKNPQKQAKVKEYERQIDQMVYKLYSLTEGEIKIVEGGE